MTISFDVHEALSAAVEAAKAAGNLLEKKQSELLKNGYSSINVGTKSSPTDYATDADREAQRIIVECIQKEYPSHRFLGEEGDTDHLGDPDSPYRWIIDPLDGTTNFIHGKPNYGTIIALQENDATILGVMTRPRFNETYTAIRGEGTFMNGNRCQLRKTVGMSDAILCCNIMHRAEQFPGGRLMVEIPRCAMIENYSNAVEEFTTTLRGWNDGMFFDGPKLWDAAAGCLMIEEAGGRSRLALKDPKNDRGAIRCVATTKEIFPDVEAFVFKTIKTSL